MGFVDHRLRVGELLGVEVEGVDAGGVGSIDPHRAGREIEAAHRAEIRLELGLVVVFVPPHQRPEPPASGQAWGSGHVVVVPGHVEGVGGRKQVEEEPVLAREPGAEGRGDTLWICLGDVEDSRIRVLDEEAEATGAGHEGDGDVRFVVGALEGASGLELHRAQLAAMVDAVEVLAETVEGFVGAGLHVETEIGDALCVEGAQLGREPVVGSDGEIDLGRTPSGVFHQQRDGGVGALRDGESRAPMPGETLRHLHGESSAKSGAGL